jgi:NADP-dependent aldehyde dehydrogenase
MGSANPVFVLPDALARGGEQIAKALAASVTLGCGQFCTSPGVILLQRSADADTFLEGLGQTLAEAPAGTMVHAGITSAYEAELEAVAALPGVSVAARSSARGPSAATEARAALLLVDHADWARQPRLGEEIYGPVTLGVRCASPAELLDAARALEGHLTATVHATEKDLADYPDLIPLLARKAGRVLVGGVPTGVEVSPAMHHGGPWPATTDPRATSVGTAAILRFARPVCYQNVPDAALPDELRNANARGLWRLVDGQPTRDPL